MARKLRFIPPGGAVVEVTCRTIHGRMLLKPHRRLNEAIVGALARAKRRYKVQMYGAVYLANHCHLLLGVDDAQQLARFMAFVNAKVAREAGLLWNWREKLWGRRYQAIVVSDQEAAQVARLRYLISHGVKENLVERCCDWPGLHCSESLRHGKSLTGFWFDRSGEFTARRYGATIQSGQFAEAEELRFDALPCWSHLDSATYRRRIARLIRDVESEARAMRRRRHLKPLGLRRLRRFNARMRGKALEKRPAPAFHTATEEAKLELLKAYRWFSVEYRRAADRLRAGVRFPGFPEGSFPPPLPFVATAAVLST